MGAGVATATPARSARTARIQPAPPLPARRRGADRDGGSRQKPAERPPPKARPGRSARDRCCGADAAGSGNVRRRQMLFVVAAHLGRKAGNVVPPASQNFSNNGINALAHTELNMRLQLDRFHRFRLSRQHHPVMQQCLAPPQGLFRCAPRELGMVVQLREMRQHYVRCVAIIFGA